MRLPEERAAAARSPVRREADVTALDGPEFKAAAERALRRGEARGLVLVVVDVGHLDPGSGAAALVAAESRTARVVRPGDVVGRLGHGRIAVLAGRDEGREGAARIAERVADRLAEPFHIAGREVELGLRIGIAMGDGRGAAALLRRAEESLATIRGHGA